MVTDITFEHVCFGYSGSKEVLHDICMDIRGPGLTCIIGPNGVGKSTLIKCINKLLKPTSGVIRIDGRDITEMTQKEIAQIIAYVPVEFTDVFAMSVFDTVLIGRHNKHKWKTSNEDLVAVHKVLEVVGMSKYADRMFNELSAGQKQNINIARGLVQETPVLILDEPTANLDVKHQIYITELLRELANRNDLTIIMISHDLNIASKFADNLVMMSKPGVIYATGTPNDVINPDNVYNVYGANCDIMEYEGRPAVLLSYLVNDDLD